jgi:glucosamine--fructose-6-phosphate aminotransferase (isomerizing)
LKKYKKENIKLEKVQIVNQVVGAYAIAVFDKKNPNEIIAALRSPLAIGIGRENIYRF